MKFTTNCIMEQTQRSRTMEMLLYLSLFMFYLYCSLEYFMDKVKMEQKTSIYFWVSKNVEEPYDPQHYVLLLLMEVGCNG